MFQVLQLYLTEKHDNFVKCAVSPGIMSRIEVTHITYWFDSKWGGAWLVLKYTLSFNLWSFSMLVIHSSTLTVPNNSQSFQSALLALFYNNLTQAGDNWERERESINWENSPSWLLCVHCFLEQGFMWDQVQCGWFHFWAIFPMSHKRAG